MAEQQQATVEAPEESEGPRRIGLGEVILAFILYFVVQIVAGGIIAAALGYDAADLTRGTGLLLLLAVSIGSGSACGRLRGAGSLSASGSGSRRGSSIAW